MVNLRAIFKLPATVATVVAIVALTVAACGGGGGGVANNGCAASSAHILGYGGGGGGGGNGTNCNPPPAASPTPAATPVGLLLTGENNVSVAPYGNVKGFFPGTNGSPPSGSNVVNLTAMQTVVFTNTEGSSGFPHTASFIQSWTSSGFPANPAIPSTASTAGASISSSGFSSGNLNPGQTSAVYSAGTPGMFIVGCAYHYVSNGMRTVIIVH